MLPLISLIALLSAHAADVTESVAVDISITSPAPAPKSVRVGQYLELEVNISGPLTLEKYSVVLLQNAIPVSDRFVLAGPLLVDQRSVTVEHLGMNQLVVSLKAIAAKESRIVPPITFVAAGSVQLSPLEVKTSALPLDITSYIKSAPNFERRSFWRLYDTGGLRVPLIVGLALAFLATLGLVAYLFRIVWRWARRIRQRTPMSLRTLRDRLHEVQTVEDAKEYAFAATAFLRDLLEIFEREPVHDKADREIVEHLRRHSRSAPIAKRVQTILEESQAIRYSTQPLQDTQRVQWGKSLEEICRILEKEHEDSLKENP